MNITKKINAIMDWLYCEIPKDSKVLVPVSGRSDSALCFWLCSQAVSIKTQGVYIGKSENLLELEWFRKTGSLCIEPPLIPDLFPNQAEILRWAHFQMIAQLSKRVLIGSRNHTEDILGTYSLASRVATHLPIIGLWKSEVLEMCEHIGMPKEIIEASSLSDPNCGRPAELASIPIKAIDSFCMAVRCQSSENISWNNYVDLSNVPIPYLLGIREQNFFKRSLPKHGPIV